ncbi:MAG: response regulator [Ekhidna sp.]|nr:response regulator [Ekhidna sp.]MBC6426105.1 response regulator [Ekhidna sp.]
MKTIKYTTKKPTVITIDDSPMMTNFLKVFLSKDYDVTAYNSTTKALKELSGGVVSPDCILTDFHVANDLTGLEFIAKLKEVDPIIPVLVLSGSCDMNQKIACLKNGAVDFISKPFNPMELNVRINNALTASSQLNQYRYAV